MQASAQPFPTQDHCEALIMTSIAIVKANGVIAHPSIKPISSCCHIFMYSAVVKQSLILVNYALIKYLMLPGMLKTPPIKDYNVSCGTEPKALATYTKTRSLLSRFAS